MRARNSPCPMVMSSCSSTGTSVVSRRYVLVTRSTSTNAISSLLALWFDDNARAALQCRRCIDHEHLAPAQSTADLALIPRHRSRLDRTLLDLVIVHHPD